MTDLSDLIDDAEDVSSLYGLDQAIGRYRFPPPPGVGRPRGGSWRRTTNLVKAFSDQYRLQQWLERMTLLGLLANDGLLFDELAASGIEYFPEDVQAKALRDWAEKARSAVGADKGPRKGTARHNVLEHYIMAGEVIGHRRMQVQMHELIDVMDRKGFEFIPGSQESYIWHPAAGGVVGRRDARFLCRRTGQIGTADLKTPERFWTYQEYAGQQWIYDTAPWVWEGPLSPAGRWIPQACGTYIGREGGPCPGKPAALLLHMPSKPTGAPVEPHEIDLDYGRRVVEEAERITALRSEGKNEGGKMVGGICPE